MGKPFPYMKWYPSDFDSDEEVKLMTLEELGFYLKCLNHSWVNKGLPGSVELIARLTGLSAEHAERLWGVVGRKYRRSGNRYVNDRQERERAAAIEVSKKRSAAGKSGADAKHKPQQKHGTCDVDAEANGKDFAGVRAFSSGCNNSGFLNSSEDEKTPEAVLPADLAHLASAVDSPKPTPDGWEEFVEAASRAQMVLDPAVSSEACKCWRGLSMEDRLAAVDGIRKRIANGDYADGAYIPSAENYIRKRKWRESLRPAPSPSPPRRDPGAYLRNKIRAREEAERKGELV